MPSLEGPIRRNEDRVFFVWNIKRKGFRFYFPGRDSTFDIRIKRYVIIITFWIRESNFNEDSRFSILALAIIAASDRVFAYRFLATGTRSISKGEIEIPSLRSWKKTEDPRDFGKRWNCCHRWNPRRRPGRSSEKIPSFPKGRLSKKGNLRAPPRLLLPGRLSSGPKLEPRSRRDYLKQTRSFTPFFSSISPKRRE